MKVVFKFTDGTRVVDEEFSERTLYQTGNLVDNIQSWKDNDSPITFKGDEETFKATGKDLVSVEIIPE
ncbi:hypothetical protein [Marinococcus luteus]|uniref:hypothetical protein n=1 Tax=Marinococcus luteus TaxID=1122204 RepID=UPI002ACC5D14|nr:hypothetical protein [Marinococcus luteus]MDZ5784611.1 hypothetical protein [Marinococcus luteus]